MRKKCPYSELFWSAFSRIWNEYGTERYEVSLRIQSERRKIQTRITAKVSLCIQSECAEIRTRITPNGSLRIQSEFGKILTKLTPNMDTFHAVITTGICCLSIVPENRKPVVF